MNDDQTFQRLREISWRRKLTEAEAAELRAWLTAHPEARAEWEGEAQMSGALDELRDAPVASNFTARVLQAVERDETRRDTGPVAWWEFRWLGRGLLPKAALVVIVAGFGVLVQQQRQLAERRKVAQSVVALSAASRVPSVDVLQNYDTIRRLGRTPPADEELLALLQ